ncbi:MAG: nicotinate-nucleotide adenylyltransferase [Spirochaetes bacterium]|nr:MAG: nicotinate-nucleotide adenylyltransferase [Spirochaetota bacterium]
MPEVYNLRDGPGAVLRIGVFGGTFNPIHHGHLICAAHVRDEYALDTVLFVPSKRPVHKEIKSVGLAEERARMIELAIEGDDRFALSRMELDRKEESYTILTVRRILADVRDSNVFLVIGADSYAEFHTWKEYGELLGLVTLIVMNRPGVAPLNEHLAGLGARVEFASNPYIGISSSEIRNRLHSGRGIRYLVPEPVECYIHEKGLYLS